jgi:hypothetical protein
VPFAVKHAGVMKGADTHVASLLGILSDMAMENNKPIYLVRREGIDLIQRPDTDEDILDFVIRRAWVKKRRFLRGLRDTAATYGNSDWPVIM